MAPRRIDPRTLPPSHPLASRLRALAERPRVTVEHDGVGVTAYEGEPVALALAASGRTSLARSPKYHRPRGPMCMRGACDGCLVRVGDTPGVMACRTPAAPGTRVTSQNAFPSAGFDVFRVTDWFFPKHMDHHHLMVGFGGALNRTMQVFARRMAGLGTLPEEPGAAVPHATRDVDVLVVGAGASGCAAAEVLRGAGASVLVVDEDDAPGGEARDDVRGGEVPATSAEVLTRASAVATWDDGTLVLAGGALTLVRARARLFANGTHDGVGAFGRNDLPGVYTARAFARAASRGVLLGERVVVVGRAHPWAGELADFARAAGAEATWLPDAEPVEADGVSAVTGVTVREGASTRALDCDCLVVAEAPMASYELAGQAGAAVAWDDARGCFAPVADDDGRTAAPGVFVAGSLRRAWATRAERADDGARVARGLREAL